MTFREVMSTKRDLDQKYSVGSESTHEWEEAPRAELPSAACAPVGDLRVCTGQIVYNQMTGAEFTLGAQDWEHWKEAQLGAASAIVTVG